jgi:mannose-6-phosphate isomerase
MLYPFILDPILKERVWGDRNLERLYQKPVPPGVPIGESWEITDRPEGISTILNGPLAGRNLHWLVEHHYHELLGTSSLSHGCFPLLVKILDASEKLSVQVHPPPSAAERLGGEPKTEMWYVAHAEPGAEIYVGLKRGVSRSEFENKIANGQVADCLHRVPVNAGDAMFLPSGRLHAIGAGLVIFEIQQNSDTTYRVFDWNRAALDGKPRALHIRESLASIEFQDFEPKKIEAKAVRSNGLQMLQLVRDTFFTVDLAELSSRQNVMLNFERAQIFGVLTGKIEAEAGGETVALNPGQFCLVPASLGSIRVTAPDGPATFMRTEPGEA